MWFCTETDLINAFSEQELIKLTNRTQPRTGVIVTEVLDQAIADSTAEINLYLAGRNLLPLPTVPAVLTRIACDITRYYLYQCPGDDSAVSMRYRQRVKQLEHIAAGRLSLGLDTDGDPVEPEDVVLVSPGRNMFKSSGGLW
jgi:phage gp36-like protein